MQRLPTLLCFLAVLAAVPLTAQEDLWYIGKPLADVRFEGLSSVSENELSGLIRPFLGRPYTDALSWELQGKLYALDYFDLIIPEVVSLTKEDRTAAVLVLQVQEKPLVGQILFSGNSKVRRGELLDTVLVKEGDLLNPGTLRFDEQALMDFYLEKGFIEAAVTSEYAVDEESNSAEIIFTIDEGSQTKISEILFVGNEQHVSDGTLRNLMQTKAQSLFRKGLFVETKLQEDIKAIERYYGDQGFIDMSVTNVDKEVVFDEEAGLNKMIITISIEEGEAWSYGGMTFSGNRIYTLEELEESVQQQPGDTFGLTTFQLDYQRIIDLYFENGYIFNTFTYEEDRDEDTRTVSYSVQIVERDRAHIENIIIRGNDKTKSFVIRREIPLEEGEVFSKAKIVEGVRNLYKLQYFGTIKPQPYPGSADGLMDLVVDVSEGQTSNLAFGMAFSGGPDFPVSLQLNWSDRNFLGRGQNIGFQANVSPDVQSALVKFTEPRILGERWSGGIQFSYSHRKNNYINQDSDGNGLPDPYLSRAEYGKAGRVVPSDYQMSYMSHFISTGLSTGYSWVTSLGRVGISTGFNFGWEYVYYNPTVYKPLNSNIADNLYTWKYDDSISLKLAWDTRDLQFDATRGFIFSEKLTFAAFAGLLPFTPRNYIKSITRFNINRIVFDIPVGDKGGSFKSIVSLTSAFHTLFDNPWIDKAADLQRDGFYVDGMFIGRGWKPTSGFRYLWDNKLEIKIPIVRSILSFDLFFDVVGAWVTTRGEFATSNALFNMRASDWRFSFGGGIRFANPQFPIGIYLAKKFSFNADGSVKWNPEPDQAEFKGWGMDLVIAFSLDIY